jgi:hypothetical protein
MNKLSHALLLDEIATALKRPTPDNRTDRELGTNLLSLIAARLSDVTPEMVEAWADTGLGDCPTEIEAATADWHAMLNASALGNGGKE